MLDKISPRSPVRLPSWRWERARLALLGQLVLTRADDQLTHDAAAFQLARGDATTIAELSVVEAHYSAIFWAARYAASQPEEDRSKSELEARILANCVDEEIAVRMGTDPDIVETYARLFFDVRPKLNSPGYIVHQVIGPELHGYLRANNADVLWKLFGYYGGPRVLDALISTFAKVDRPLSETEMSDYFDRTFSADVKRKTVIAAKTLRIADQTVPALFEVHVRLKELQEARRGGVGGEEAVMENLKTSLTTIGGMWRVRHANDGSSDDDVPGFYRPEELLLLESGQFESSLSPSDIIWPEKSVKVLAMGGQS